MTAVQRIADLFRPDRQRRHWPTTGRWWWSQWISRQGRVLPDRVDESSRSL